MLVVAPVADIVELIADVVAILTSDVVEEASSDDDSPDVVEADAPHQILPS